MNNKTTNSTHPIPKLVSLLFVMRWPLVFPFIKNFIKLLVPNLKNTNFINGFECQFWNIFCEENTFLSDTFFIDHVPIFIWAWSRFTRKCIVITWDHEQKWGFEKAIFKEVHIWKNVWITTNVTILSWVNIWDNTIIWAWSVVTKDIPANCIAAWNPCKVIRYLDQNK